MQDVEDLIALVQDVKPYVDSALTYTREQAKRGLLMTDLDAVIDYCTGIVEQGENSAVLTAMQASIDALSATEQEKRIANPVWRRRFGILSSRRIRQSAIRWRS